jgi:hypothetical protein
MARFKSQQKMGFYPLPPHLVPAIAEYLTVPDPEKTMFVDPCAGEGEALKLLGDAFGVTHLYANELDESRAEACRALGLTGVCCGDGVRELKANESHFSLLLLNPPYDFEGEGEGRTEWKFLRTLRFLQNDGILVFVAPLSVLRRKDFMEKLPIRIKDITVCRFPDADFASFGQAVLFAKRRIGRVREEFQNYQRQVDNPLILGDGQLPDFGRYAVPPVAKPQITYFRSENCDAHTLRLLAKTPIVQKLLGHGLSKVEIVDKAPLTPFRPGHKAMMLATGALDGVYRRDDGSLVSLAGMTEKITTTIEEDNEERTTLRTRTTPTSKVLGLLLEETIRQNELVIIEYR